MAVLENLHKQCTEDMSLSEQRRREFDAAKATFAKLQKDKEELRIKCKT